MIRRLIVALAALLVAAVGGVLTFLYASAADSRAMERMSPTEVLMVAEPISEGSAAESLARSVLVSEIPSAAVVPGALTDLGDVAGMVTTTDLQPGEQLLSSRFAAPEDLDRAVEVPEDLLTLSLQLEPKRVIGGELRPGDTVGVFISATVRTDGGEIDQTHLILHKVLVVEVVGAASVDTNEDGEEVQQAVADTLMVTLALSPADAERVVFGHEFGSVYLSLESSTVPEEGTRIVTVEEAFE
ncbi:Flp pilus assembly protein CpaB [Agrococcus carbonis]|uniref:Pilus assembly protein CpaB n=1 Tax=Agrococcus carbonis TaxID=684552 RepID=A0A1H1S623_9MICO|nr:Flp pilus assembly protein CpaB [Agrococcus carbonis]SDS42719.1 pilus assembly protein CpaB [Agrococcus carbonis]